MTAYHTEELTRAGLTFRVEHHRDEYTGAPWDEHDCHGIVTEWTSREKRPGELVLDSDGHQRRYYDFAASCRRALAEGWDAPPYGGGTPRQRAARAARADFERLRDWCDDEWHWCCVVVVLLDDEGEELDRASLWGIESDAGDYLTEVAAELADELAASAAEKATEKAASLTALATRATTAQGAEE